MEQAQTTCTCSTQAGNTVQSTHICLCGDNCSGATCTCGCGRSA